MSASGRRVVRSIGVASVVRIVFVISLAVWAILLVGIVALYLLGLVSGGLGGVEGLIASLGFAGFRFTIVPFILAFIAVSMLASVASALFGALMALLYNNVAPLVGGVSIRSDERR